MVCCRGYEFTDGGERAFEVDSSRVLYGSGALAEAGAQALALGAKRVGLFTDERIAKLEIFATVRDSLAAAGLDVVVYDRVHVEPTDLSFAEAIAFAKDANLDSYVSIGGGSAIDTAKAANLYATYPAPLDTYVNAPIGEGRPVPGPLRPHIACPTTCGTGSEVTGIAIFDYLAHHAKTGIASRRLRPSLGIIDPDVTKTLPSTVVACSGFDVLSHALESFTAVPYTHRAAPATPSARPMSQGANPFSDLAVVEALSILGEHLERAVADARDLEARERMMYAATLAGIGFGNAGVHVPHAMSYAVAGLVERYTAPEYPQGAPIVPHGMAVIVNAPAVVKMTARANPERHLRAAELLGADVRGLGAADAGEVLSQRIAALMRATKMPNGVGGVGFTSSDIAHLRASAWPQQRLLKNAPIAIDEAALETLFTSALQYW